MSRKKKFLRHDVVMVIEKGGKIQIHRLFISQRIAGKKKEHVSNRYLINFVKKFQVSIFFQVLLLYTDCKRNANTYIQIETLNSYSIIL